MTFTKSLTEPHCKSSINHFRYSLNPFNLLKQLTLDYVKLESSFAEVAEDNEEKQEGMTKMVQSLHAGGVLTDISLVQSSNVLVVLWQYRSQMYPRLLPVSATR